MKKLFVILLVITLVGALLVGCGSKGTSSDNSGNAGDQQTYTWKFAHEEIDGSVQDLYVKKFAELMEQKSNGRVKIEIYPVGQLGDATQQAELLQNGGIEFAIVSPGNTGTIVPENQLFSLHYLLSANMDVNKKVMKESKALNEDLSALSALYEKKNIKVLAYWTEGFMDWTSSKALNKPEDFQGFKMRTMPSPMIVAAYEAYGANPTPVPYMEVYSGLQLNMIEGQENPLFAIEEMKFYEVQKYLTLSNHCLYVTTTATNPDFFNALPDDIKQMVLETIEELRDYSFDIQQDLNDQALEKIKNNSKIPIVELTAEQTEAFRQASMKARDRYVQMVGEEGKAIMEKLAQEVIEAEKAIQ